MSTELDSLIRKVKVIHAVSGGLNKPITKLSEIDAKQQNLRDHMQNVDDLQLALTEEHSDQSYNAIRMKNQLRCEKEMIRKCASDLKPMMQRRKVDDVTKQNIQTLMERVKEYLPAEPRYEQTTRETTDDVISGKYKVLKREAITIGQQKQIDEIVDEHKQQDEILDEIEKVVVHIHNTGNIITDELQRGNVILESTIKKTNNTNDKLEKTNDSMVSINKIINSNTGKICSYIVCCVILLVLVYIFLRITKL